MKVRPSIECVGCSGNISTTWMNAVFSAKRSPLRTLLITTTDGIYKVPTNGTAYGTKKKLIEGKLMHKNQNPCCEYSTYIKNVVMEIGVICSIASNLYTYSVLSPEN